MPLLIDNKVQETLSALAHALSKAFSVSSGQQQGDPSWGIEGISERVWKIKHPALPTVKDSRGSQKQVLLQLHIREPKKAGEKWMVIGQNKVVGPDSNTAPKAEIIATEENPPGPTWNLDQIAADAAAFFKKQLEDLKQKAEAATPAPPVGMPPPPAEGGIPPMPTGSRKQRLAFLINK